MDHIDWQINKRPLECAQYMLENQLDCDLTFKVGENEELIRAHKFILSMRSPVFQKMLNGPFIETNQDPVIPDVEPEAFKALLRYCYYECVEINAEVAFYTLYAAKKYMLPLLENAARDIMIQTLSCLNIWSVYIYAVSVEDSNLHSACKSFLQSDIRTAREALNSTAFLGIPHEVLHDLLQSNKNAHETVFIKGGERYYKTDVGIPLAEIDLFKACNEWAAAQCIQKKIDPTGANKREILGECIHQLRFPTMLTKVLMNVVYPVGILTQEEMFQLCQYRLRETGSDVQVDFPSKAREFMVVPPSSPKYSGVIVQPDERVILTRIWVRRTAVYLVTLKNEQSNETSSKWYRSTYQNCTNLVFLNLEPQVLKAGSRYSVSIEDSEESQSVHMNTEIGPTNFAESTPFKEVKLTRTPGFLNNCEIHALSLSFV